VTYDEALEVATKNAENFPTFERDGRMCIEVEGKVYPKDWFIRTAARMKSQGEI